MTGGHEPGVVDSWYRLIGEAVVAAAYTESAVGTLLYALEHGDTEQFYARVFGELLKRCTYHADHMDDGPVQRDLRLVITDAGRAATRRNDLVHGWWRFGIDGQAAIRGRASRQAPDLMIQQVRPDDLRSLITDLHGVRDRALHLSKRIADL